MFDINGSTMLPGHHQRAWRWSPDRRRHADVDGISTYGRRHHQRARWTLFVSGSIADSAPSDSAQVCRHGTGGIVLETHSPDRT